MKRQIYSTNSIAFIHYGSDAMSPLIIRIFAYSLSLHLSISLLFSQFLLFHSLSLSIFSLSLN